MTTENFSGNKDRNGTEKSNFKDPTDTVDYYNTYLNLSILYFPLFDISYIIISFRLLLLYILLLSKKKIRERRTQLACEERNTNT